MNQYLVFAALGLGAGALFATMAQGLVLTHRGAGVINLANGAIALYVAYTYAGIRDGRLMIPPLPNPLSLVEWVVSWFGVHLSLPDIPAFVDLGSDPGTGPAIGISAAIAVALGYLIHILVYRPLRHASPLAKTIASVGILLTLQAVVILRFGTDDVSVPSSLPSDPIGIGGTQVPMDRFILAGIAIVIALALAAAFRYTRLGIATRAASENEKGAVLLGLSPNRLAAVNWMLSSLVSGIVGILFASLTGLNPTDYVLYVIPALAAALVARLESFTLAAVAGLLIGCADSIVVIFQGRYSWFPTTGASTGVPFLVIIIVMIARGRNLPERGALGKIRLSASPEPRRVGPTVLVIGTLTVAGLIWLPFDLRSALQNSMIGAVVALSFVVLVGFAGQISLFQLGIAGLAALLMTRLAGDMGLPFPVSAIVAVLAAAAAGTIAGLPALRIRGVQLAVVTLAAGYVFQDMVLNNQNYLRPSDASNSVPPPSIGGFQFGVNGGFPFGSPGSPSASFGIFLLIVTLACFALVVRLRRSDIGRQMLAVRSNERAAAGLGISVTATKLLAFAVAALLAGIAGVLYSYQFEGVTEGPYVAIASVSALAIAYLGGISTVSGAAVAGTLVAGGLSFRILERIADLGQYEMLISGVGLILAAVLNPEGIVGATKDMAEKARRYLRKRFVRPSVTVHDEPRPYEDALVQSSPLPDRRSNAG